MIEQKTIPAQLLYSVCSLGAHVCPDLELRSYKTILAKHAKRLLWADVESVCLENIQTCILLANIVAADQDPSSEVLFFGVAPIGWLSLLAFMLLNRKMASLSERSSAGFGGH